MRGHGLKLALALLIALAGCGSDTEGTGTETTTTPPTASSEPNAVPVSPSEQAPAFPTAVFARLGDEPVSEELAAELQAVLEIRPRATGSRRR